MMQASGPELPRREWVEMRFCDCVRPGLDAHNYLFNANWLLFSSLLYVYFQCICSADLFMFIFILYLLIIFVYVSIACLCLSFV